MKEQELLNNIRVICDPDKKGQQETAKEVFLNSGKKNINETSEEQEKAKSKKLKLTANLYTVSFNAFMKSNKETYKLKQNDQIDIFYRAIFMTII